jgi:hypothetical protein
MLLCFAGDNFGVTHTFTWSESFVSTGDDLGDPARFMGSLSSRLVSSIAAYAASVTMSAGTGNVGILTIGIKETTSGTQYTQSISATTVSVGATLNRQTSRVFSAVSSAFSATISGAKLVANAVLTAIRIRRSL